MKIRLEIEGKNAGSLNYKGAGAAELAAAYLNSIQADEVYVHFVKDDGTRAYAEFSGKSVTMSAARFIQSAAKAMETPFQTVSSEPPSLTLKERLELFLRFEFQGTWFSSLEVKQRYESIYGKINLSTISTYLARMCGNNLLERRGKRNEREYHFKEDSLLREAALAK